MLRSKLFFLNLRDFAHGFFLAFVSALLTFLTTKLQVNQEISWWEIALVSGVTFLSYLIKNLVSNSKGKLFKSEVPAGTKQS